MWGAQNRVGQKGSRTWGRRGREVVWVGPEEPDRTRRVGDCPARLKDLVGHDPKHSDVLRRLDLRHLDGHGYAKEKHNDPGLRGV